MSLDQNLRQAIDQMAAHEREAYDAFLSMAELATRQAMFSHLEGKRFARDAYLKMAEYALSSAQVTAHDAIIAQNAPFSEGSCEHPLVGKLRNATRECHAFRTLSHSPDTERSATKE